jgi:alginate O-acetyltransferase complex protein AlgI
MLFNSPEFLLFFPIVTILFFALPHRARWVLLLAASCFFYMSFIPAYILVLFAVILIDYTSALFIEQSSGKRRKIFLVLSLAANLGMLVFFRYYNFFKDSLAPLSGTESLFPYGEILLPVGLSFHTFQAMSYTIEVYRGNFKAEKHLGIYALYVMFYPQLVAGPIERPQNLLPQFYRGQVYDHERVKSGLLLMGWGFFKKVVLADRLAVLVEQVYSSPSAHNGPVIWLATCFFTLQLYCDFSGYSDIAIGAARVMGFKLMQNFRRPYFSVSMAEFWHRWHISLSTWFRDYVYIPLGGNRVPAWKWCFSIMLVFLLSGLWHGANYTFLVFGLLNGFYLLFAAFTPGLQSFFLKGGKWINRLIVFHLWAFTLIFFRSEGIDDAMVLIKNLGSGYKTDLSFPGLDAVVNYAVIALSLLILFAKELLDPGETWTQRISALPLYFRWPVYWGLIFFILWFGFFRNPASFIYFQF